MHKQIQHLHKTLQFTMKIIPWKKVLALHFVLQIRTEMEVMGFMNLDTKAHNIQVQERSQYSCISKLLTKKKVCCKTASHCGKKNMITALKKMLHINTLSEAEFKASCCFRVQGSSENLEHLTNRRTSTLKVYLLK